MTVRRSVRGKNNNTKDEEEKEERPTSPGKDESFQQEVKAASAEPQPHNQTPEGCLERGKSRTDIKGRRKEKAEMLSQPR